MNLTIKEILSFGLQTTKKHYRKVLLVIAIYFLFNLVPDFITRPLADSNKLILLLLSFLISFTFLIFETFFHVGVTKESLKIVRGEEGSIKNTFNYKHLFFRVFFASIIYAVLVCILALLIFLPFFILSFFLKNLIPIYVGLFFTLFFGTFLAIAFGFSKVIVIDKGCTPLEGLKMSKHLTKGVVGRLAVIFLAFLGFNLLGLLALGIGLIITVPSTFFGLLFIYNSLLFKDSVVS